MMKSINLPMLPIQFCFSSIGKKIFLLLLIIFTTANFQLKAEEQSAGTIPEPVYEWVPATEEDAIFTGDRSIPVPEARQAYNLAEPFSVEIQLTPDAEQDRLAGIVSDYAGSGLGGWYLSMGDTGASMRPSFVAIEDGTHRAMHSNKDLTPGESATLLLIKSQTEYRLWLNGELVAEYPVGGTLSFTKEPAFLIGQRLKNYFHGKISLVRVWDTAIPEPAGSVLHLQSSNSENESASPAGSQTVGTPIYTTQNHLWNSSFEDGKTLEENLAWARMTGTESEIPQGWEVASDEAYDGQQSLKTTLGAPLVLTTEDWSISKRSWVFSVWLKAAQNNVPCTLGVGAYWRLDERITSEKVMLTNGWKRYEVVVPQLPMESHMKNQGGVNFYITPEKGATVWVDAVQWESGSQAGAWTLGETASDEEASQPQYPNADVIPQPEGGNSSWTGEIPLHVHSEVSSELSIVEPVTVGVPFRKDLWNGEGKVLLRNAAGKEIPVQTEVLARQEQGAVRMLGVTFAEPFQSGTQSYTLHIEKGEHAASEHKPFQWQIEPATKPGRLWDSIKDTKGNKVAEAASIQAVDGKGIVYDSEADTAAEWKIENDGDIYKSFRSAGRLLSADGKAILGYVARVHVWRDIPGVKVEVSVINTRSQGSVVIRNVCWTTKSGQTGVTSVAGQAGDGLEHVEKRALYWPKENRFESLLVSDNGTKPLKPDAVQFIDEKTENKTIVLLAPDAWKYNPSAIAWDKGTWKGYLWPDTGVRSVFLPRGLALTREYWLREGSGEEAAVWEKPAIGIAASQWWEKNDVILPFAANDSQKHPFMDHILDPNNLMKDVSVEKIIQQKAWGVFDYGDFHGDGGWANLESFRDWAMVLTGLRAEDFKTLSEGFRSSHHYREIDMNQNDGSTYVHNGNHVSGSNSTSHAWPNGVALNYLLTGSKRSKELVLKHGEFILNTSEAELADTGLRVLGRWLLNLADVYLISGDARYKEKYFTQIERSRAALANDKDNPDRSIFSNIGSSGTRRLIPFHAWYGIAALEIMQDLTGDDRLSDFISEEIAATLNPELYVEDIKQLWPNATPEEGMPIILADYARGRGSFAYPDLVSEAKKPGKEALGKLAVDALYTWAVEGRMVENIEATLASTPVRLVEDEKPILEAARNRLWNAAAEGLMNGDFSLSSEHWTYWRPFPGKSISAHINWERRRKEMVSLDTEIKKDGARSLRINLQSKTYYSTIAVDTNRFRIPEGKSRITGWVRWDKGTKEPLIRLQVRNLNGEYKIMDIATGEPSKNSGGKVPEVRFVSGKIADTDVNGWHRFEAAIESDTRAVGNLSINSQLVSDATEGHVWIDSFKFSPPSDSK